MSTQSEVADLVKRIRGSVDPTDPQKRKFKVAKSGKHQKILRGNGSVLTDLTAGGPVIISGSPGDNRWREMKVNQLVRLGVFKTDPYKETRGDDGEIVDDPQTKREKEQTRAKERKAAELRDRSEGFRIRTQKVREGIEPIVSKLGGWSRGGSGVKVADFVVVLQNWAGEHAEKLVPEQTSGLPVAPSAWTAAVTNLRTAGGTIGEKWLPLFEEFVVALREGDENMDPQESSLVYMDMLRSAKGILPMPAADEREEDERPALVAPVAARVVVEWPRVALEALFWMSRGADGADRDTILDLAEEIAELAATNQERTKN